MESHDYTLKYSDFLEYMNKRGWTYKIKSSQGKAYNRGSQIVARIKITRYNGEDVYYVDHVPM